MLQKKLLQNVRRRMRQYIAPELGNRLDYYKPWSHKWWGQWTNLVFTEERLLKEIASQNCRNNH